MSSVGNCRLKLSDMTLGSWFCKLKDVAKSSRNDGSKLEKTQPQQRKGGSQRSHRRSVPGTCYHFGRDDDPNSSVSPSDLKLSDTGYFPVPSPPRGTTRHRGTNPRKSTKKKPPRVVTSSLSAGCSCRATLDSVWARTEQVSLHETEPSVSPSSDFADYSFSSVEKPPQLPHSFDQMVSWSTSRSFGVNLNSNDIVIDLGETSLETDVELPLEKPLKFTDMVNNVRRPENASRTPSAKVIKDQKITVKDRVTGAKPGSIRGFAVNSQGVRLQLNSKSRRFRSRKRTQGSHRKISVPASQSSVSGTADRRTSVPDSFAVIKSSADPRRDFRESMVEMIVENNIWASKDLEELLACYLALNSDEYHDVIISVFKQLWFDLSDLRLK